MQDGDGDDEDDGGDDDDDDDDGDDDGYDGAFSFKKETCTSTMYPAYTPTGWLLKQLPHQIFKG